MQKKITAIQNKKFNLIAILALNTNTEVDISVKKCILEINIRELFYV